MTELSLNTFYPVQSNCDGLLTTCDKKANILIYAAASTDVEPRLVKAVYTSNEVFNIELPIGFYFQVKSDNPNTKVYYTTA